MLLLVLILVLIAFGLLVVALLTGSVLWAWVSVGVSVGAAAVLVIDWLQRRSAVKAGEEPQPEQAVASSGTVADVDPITEVLAIVPPGTASRAGSAGPTAGGASGTAGPDARFGEASAAERTMWIPAVQPSGSGMRPPGAEEGVTPSGSSSSQTVVNSPADPSPVETAQPGVPASRGVEHGVDPDATVITRRDAASRPGTDGVPADDPAAPEPGGHEPDAQGAHPGDGSATTGVDIRKDTTTTTRPGAQGDPSVVPVAGPSASDPARLPPPDPTSATGAGSDPPAGSAPAADRTPSRPAGPPPADVGATVTLMSPAAGRPGGPVAPASTGTPGSPGLPAASGAPGSPGTPESSGAPGTPPGSGAPGSPGVAESSGVSGRPGSPGGAGTPEGSGGAQGSGAPQAAGGPEASGLPEASGVPGGTGAPDRSATSEGAAPQSVDLPEAPDAEIPEEPPNASVAALVAGLEDEVEVIDEQPRYHLAGCRALAVAPPIPLPVREAVELGFTPCAWCSPDATLAARHPAPAR